MEIEFSGRDLHAACNGMAALAKRWGHERAALVAQRLAELHALDRLADLAHLPHIAVHEVDEVFEIETGADLTLIISAEPDPKDPPREKLTVLAIEDRQETL